MDYDGLSSPESRKTPADDPQAFRNSARFVILWHAMPPKKPIESGMNGNEPRVLATGFDVPAVYPIAPGASAHDSGAPGASANGSGKHGIPLENRSSHFDLMLERAGRLTTFELSHLPIPGERFAIRSLADHRIEYLDYAGPVSGDRGHVTPWTAGNYITVADLKEKWIVELSSPRLSARLVLIRPTPGNLNLAASWNLRASRWNVTA